MTPSEPDRDSPQGDAFRELKKEREALAELQRVSNELGLAETFDDLCRQAIVLGRNRLGFDRLSLWFRETGTNRAHGAFGTDENGELRDERDQEVSFSANSVMGKVFLGDGSPYVDRNAPLYSDKAKAVGRGTHVMAPLTCGGEIIGCVTTDNLINQIEITDADIQLLSLYASTLGHLCARKRAERSLRESRAFLEHMADGAYTVDTEGNVLWTNPAAEKMTGLPLDQIIGKPFLPLFAEADRPALIDTYKRVLSGESVQNELTLTSGITCQFFSLPRRNAKGEIIGTFGVARDITEMRRSQEEQRRLQEQLTQAQKMEAVGQLAGGIAHDFNNLLQVILGCGEIALGEMTEDNPHCILMTDILEAGTRAKSLVSQLLAFSRRQVLDMREIDLNDTVGDMLKMLRRLIGEHIDLNFLSGHDLGMVRADPGQIGQILTNLCVNSRDAMPDGGMITIETRNTEIDARFCETHPWARPGRFILLRVTDTGCGMSEDTVEHIFEPFFTTKEVGQGSGLGLSTVYGLVQQHEGFMHVESEPDKGTTLNIYLPETGRSASIVEENASLLLKGGTETILLAEDDAMVRNLTKAILERAGYTILTACDGEEALQIFRPLADEIDLALLDVMMPRLSGRAVYESIREIRPNLPVVFASGYSLNALGADFLTEEPARLIQKPMRRAELLRTVREALDDQ